MGAPIAVSTNVSILSQTPSTVKDFERICWFGSGDWRVEREALTADSKLPGPPDCCLRLNKRRRLASTSCEDGGRPEATRHANSDHQDRVQGEAYRLRDQRGWEEREEVVSANSDWRVAHIRRLTDAGCDGCGTPRIGGGPATITLHWTRPRWPVAPSR